MKYHRQNRKKGNKQYLKMLLCVILVCAVVLSIAVTGFAQVEEKLPDSTATEETQPEASVTISPQPSQIPESSEGETQQPDTAQTPPATASDSDFTTLEPEVAEEINTSTSMEEQIEETVPPVEDIPVDSVTEAPPAWAESGQTYLKNNLLLAENMRMLRDMLKQKIEDAKAETSAEAEIIFEGNDNLYDIVAVYAAIRGQQDDFPYQVDIGSAQDTEELQQVFQNMIEVSASQATDTQNGKITVLYKGYTQVAFQYGFSAEQMGMLADMTTETAKERLLEIEEKSILGTLTDEEFTKVQEKLPENLYGEQRSVLLAALAIEGKVPYFWGGKSYYTGWDERWGELRAVTSEGSETSGTVRPFGLDCSGFVSWAFINAGGDKEVLEKIGNGTASQWQNSFAIPMEEAQPGDLLFYRSPGGEGINHVGIVLDRNEDGALQVIHCSSSKNNVVITGDTGFQYARRPYIYVEKAESSTLAANLRMLSQEPDLNPAELTGTNDAIMNQNMTDWAPLSGNSDWINYLHAEWSNVKDSFRWDSVPGVPEEWKWNGQEADPAATGTPDQNPAALPIKTGNIWDVYSGQQLRYALQNMVNGDMIALRQDIDLRGYEYNWEPIVLDATRNSGITIDGHDFTIYNLGCNNGSMLQGTSGTAATLTGGSAIVHINFISAKVMSKPAVGTLRHLGIVEKIENGSILNTVVRNSLFFSGYYDPNPPAMGADGYLSPFGFTETVSASNYYTINNLLYARQYHVGGSLARLYGPSTIENCFSVDSVVVSGYEHSGGFISCIDGGVTVRNCFTNNTVFGSKTTGVFVGGIYAFQGSFFENCYAAGTIEGMEDLGGFVGYTGTSGNMGNIRFRNCYSTSIVGMRNGGTNLGGFIGSYQASVPGVFENCYAAGEVGNIDTDVSPVRTDDMTVGGFIGMYSDISRLTFTNCFYDKQTTAMREWATGVNFDGNAVVYVDGTDENGIAHDEYLNVVTGELYKNDGNGTYTSDGGATYVPGTVVNPTGTISGLAGVMTSDSIKAGTGLTSTPGTAGFTGFSNAGEWIYDGEANGAYPIPVSIVEGVKWQTYADMVRAYTHASVAAVHLQTWDECLNGDTLPVLTYDTVRDLTERFTLTTYTDDEEQYKISWTQDGATVALDGADYPVIGYLNQAYLARSNANYWMADQFAPGIDWLTVSFTEGGETGTRRLRIIPTLNFRPGYDGMLSDGSMYNHAQDVRLAYSTGQRMARDPVDITLGVYPDEPLSEAQVQYQGITPTTTFAQENNKFDNVDTSYMTGNPRGTMGAKGETHYNNNYIRMMLYKATVSADGHIQFGEDMNIPLTNTNSTVWDKKLNGELAFSAADNGIYLLDYYWVMPDGRYVHDAKLIYVDEPKTVEMYVVNSDSWQPNPIAMMLDVSDRTPDFSAGARSETSVSDIINGTQMIAAWKQAEDGATLDSITFEIQTLFDSKSVTMDDPEVGKRMTVTLPYTSLESWNDQGEYYTQVKYVDKTYIVKYDAAGEYYYLALDNIYTEGRLYAADVDGNIRITLAVTSGYIPPEPTPEPSDGPTSEPTPEPSIEPSAEPAVTPTAEPPAAEPTLQPTTEPTDERAQQNQPKTQDSTSMLLPILLAGTAGAVIWFTLKRKGKKNE